MNPELTLLQLRPASVRRARLQLLLIIALFALPLAVAIGLFGQWRPAGSAEHGELLNPVRALSPLSALATDDTPLAPDFLHGRWTLVYVASGSDCPALCRDALWRLRQVRLAIGRDIDRVQRLVLFASMPDDASRQWLAREHPGLAAGAATTEARTEFTGGWRTDGRPGGWIYLVDPHGNLVLRYAADGEAGGMLKDLTRLLKLSQIG
ncbi:MAG TPA: cytochrome oxidase assembly protein [Plasticicumulans sp.]|uniref:cytochrome oxidase assembly protein n=1 Tax=Plasticicumulans sp. TaxID=2307179 RepID=UPI002BC47302|nr:cytochrome oxidase assembly protein [Plasticicumulans sp.]MBS0601845.1 cytochrome oxidase assembly protein [Pseudomonadota bacterium]HMV40335.1 cytochrome oxidase assembly protein [Plasticicumulans sp.]HMW28923.1 cytochrome oxidase assembly protein [Plasticicumulans sp.]HNG48311.1 cytochrome oxidase assembly protein [Plasticicumulans sp.]HNJ06683.1 cytochrome oxidase assembly protein [Plasticicumulans sp.]